MKVIHSLLLAAVFASSKFVVSFTTGPRAKTIDIAKPLSSDIAQLEISSTEASSTFQPFPNEVMDVQPYNKQVPKTFAAPPLSTWKRRLNTKQDFLGLHKISSIGFVLSGLYITGNGFACGFSEVQDYLFVPTYLFTASAVTTCVASSAMAWKYRANEPSIRNGMIDLAVVTAFQSILALWCSHFAPSIFDVEWFSKGMVQCLTLLAIVGAVDGIVRGDEMVQNRRGKDRSLDTQGNPYWLDWAQCVLPNFATLFYMGQTFKWFGIDNSRLDYLEMIQHGATTEAAGLYASVLSSLLLSSLVFFQTLRDKKLLSKDTEGWVILFASVVAVAETEFFLPSL